LTATVAAVKVVSISDMAADRKESLSADSVLYWRFIRACRREPPPLFPSRKGRGRRRGGAQMCESSHGAAAWMTISEPLLFPLILPSYIISA
jgi:hypothetical protein